MTKCNLNFLAGSLLIIIFIALEVSADNGKVVLGSITLSEIEPEIKFENIGLEDGLPDVTIFQIVQDNIGFLWFATQNGIAKYDGYKFKAYVHDPEDPHSIGGFFARCLFIDKDSIMWSATENGLSRYDEVNDNFINFPVYYESSLDFSRLPTSICEDDSGYLYFGVKESGLFKFNKNNGSYTRYIHESGNPECISSNNITFVMNDRDNKIWVGTSDSGINVLDAGRQKFTNYRSIPSDRVSLPDNRITCIKSDKAGNIWIGTASGFCLFDNSSEKFYSPVQFINTNWYSDKPLEKYYVYDIYEDTKGIFWICTAGFGILKYDRDKNHIVQLSVNTTQAKTIHTEDASCAFEDRTGLLWFGTFYKGVLKYERNINLFNVFTIKLQELFVIRNFGVTFGDISGRHWAFSKKGTFMIEEGIEKVKALSRKLEGTVFPVGDSLLTYFFEDNNGDYWIGAYSALKWFSNKTCTWKSFDYSSDGRGNSIYGNIVTAMYEDKEGNIWIGTEAGLSKLDKNRDSIRQFTEKGSNSPFDGMKNLIHTLHEDSAGDLWIGSNWGALSKLDKTTGRFTSYFYPELGFTTVSGIYDDNSGNLWTTGLLTGLTMFNKQTKKITSYGMNEGLISNNTRGIIGDKNGKIWVATQVGISKFDPVKISFKNYNVMKGKAFSPALTGFDNEGYFYFYSYYFVRFHPDKIKENAIVPRVVITGLNINGEQISPKVNSQLEENINISKQIDLTHKDNSVVLEFAALDFQNPSANQYKYKLEGVNDDWVTAGNRNSVQYTDIGPGEYVFRVIGSNNDGVWNEEGASVKINVTPQWWQTTWLKVFGILTLLCALVFIRQRKLSAMKKEMELQDSFTKLLIQSQESERKRIASELHNSLSQNLIVVRNKALWAKTKTEKSSELMDEISDISSSALEEIREISYKLHPYQLERFGLTKTIESIAARSLASNKIILKTEIDQIDKLFRPEEEINIYRIVQELINNILKHSKATEAEIVVRNKTDKILIEVDDNGQGFKPDEILQDWSEKGIGLIDIKERVKLLGGSIEYKSIRGSGTSVIIEIPLISNGRA